MITEIGIVAGEIWHCLDTDGELFLSELDKNVGKSKELLLMSLGWLAREGHVVLVKTEGDYKISLRK